MTAFLFAMCGGVLLSLGLGLWAIVRARTQVDAIVSAQLLGSGAVAIVLLLAVATASPALIDVALVLVLLAAVTAAAFAWRLGEHTTDEAGGAR